MTRHSREILDTARLLYRGDMWAAAFYILSSLLLGLLAVGIDALHLTPGFLYMSVSFYILSAYCLGKGIFLFVVARQKFRYFLRLPEMNDHVIRTEYALTAGRIEKKANSRRRYFWTTLLCTLLALVSYFSSLKSVIVGTCIPVVLTAMAELGIGLLNQFRMRTYLSQLREWSAGKYIHLTETT